jgi:hypothetical protein
VTVPCWLFCIQAALFLQTPLTFNFHELLICISHPYLSPLTCHPFAVRPFLAATPLPGSRTRFIERYLGPPGPWKSLTVLQHAATSKLLDPPCSACLARAAVHPEHLSAEVEGVYVPFFPGRSQDLWLVSQQR